MVIQNFAELVLGREEGWEKGRKVYDNQIVLL